ncbi:MAG: phage tail tip lysozyme [Butyrivibrio sp.]|nr:phage tail tip lysozyme [Acetatifactor muris]MCM1558879.1 phage tail tip lysozyme [Butyrivibrio sp.]
MKLQIVKYTGSRKEKESNSANQALEPAATYEHGTEQTSALGLYTKAQVMGTTASAENNQFQNNLKILGFYSASVATDGNLGSAESMRAIKKFQRVYGLQINGGSNAETRAKLNEVVAFYNNTLNDSELSTVAQRKKGHSDYSESTVKADVARAWTFLRMGMGLTVKQASGVMGNIIEESGASPTNANDGAMGTNNLRDTTYVYSATDGIAYGIIQWANSSRKQGLLDMANTMGSSVSDYNVQFAHFRSEMESSYKTAWKKITDKDDIKNAAEVFCKEIEGTKWNSIRKDHADVVYNALA